MRAKLFVKIFLATGIPWGLVMGFFGAIAGAAVGLCPHAFVSPQVGAGCGFLLGAASGLPFGAAMAIALGVLHFSMTSSPEVRHERTLAVDGSPEDARRMCLAAVRTVPNVSINERQSGPLRISATKGLTWRSWCDRISCDIVALGATRQQIVVRSAPWLRMTLIDYGSNLDNVEAITTALVAQGARVPAS